MTKQTINVGAAVNDGTGESLRNALIKCNGNFDELYTNVAGKEPTITSGTTAQYLRGDKSLATLNAAAVGLGNVNNTSDASKPVSTAQQTALDLKVDKGLATGSGLTLSGAALLGRGSGTGNIQELSGATAKTFLALDNVNNTSDAAKPVSTATASALALKSDTTHTHVASDINLTSASLLGKSAAGNGVAGELSAVQAKTFLQLNLVNNTADADKPISTATQTALDGKAALNHTHTIAQITNLQSSLDNKSDITHNHDITTLTGFTAFAATKANTSHTHVISDVTGLQAELVHSVKSFMSTLTANLRMASVADTNFTVVVANSKAVAGVAPTADTVLTIKKNDINIGTVTFTASNVVGTIVISNTGDRALQLGDVIELVAPGSADATLARVAFVLRN